MSLDGTNLVGDIAMAKGFPELADYFVGITVNDLAVFTQVDLIKNAGAKHRIQMQAFAKCHISQYLSPE